MSKIISKPKISERRVRIVTKTVDGEIPLLLYRMGGFKKTRVEGGWEYYTGTRWEFVRDEIEEEEIIEDEGGLLDLSRRGIHSLDEVTKWYSNNELDTIIKLDLSNNSIQNIDDITLFRNLQELNLNCNHISNIEDTNAFDYIPNIIITDNPILETDIELPINFTQQDIKPCMECGNSRSQLELNEHQTLCGDCYAEHKKEIDDEAIADILANDETYQSMLMGPQKKGCVLGLVLIIGIGFALQILIGLL